MWKIFKKIRNWFENIGETPISLLDMDVSYAQHCVKSQKLDTNEGLPKDIITFEVGRLIMRDYFKKDDSLRHTYLANIEMLLYDSVKNEFDDGNSLADKHREKIKKTAKDIFTMVFYQD